MEILKKKFLKFPLVLLAFIGFVFSLSCAFNPSEALAHHSTIPEAGTSLLESGEACCGTNLSQQHKPLASEYLAVSRETNRNPFDLLNVSLVASLMIFGLYLLDHIERRLSMEGKLYVRDNPHLTLSNTLIEAFSRGILNPKKYNLAFSN